MSRMQTYERILETSDALFRRFGYMKTPVAKIAKALGMSSANIYKFFPSKRALIEAVGQKRLYDLRRELVVVTKTRKSAFERIQDLIFSVVDHFETVIEDGSDLLYTEILQDVLIFTLERQKKDWNFPKDLRNFLENEITKLLHEGVACGEMHVDASQETAMALLDCLIIALEPPLLLGIPKSLRKERLGRQFRLLARALV